MRNYKSILCLLLSLVLIFSVVFPMGAAAVEEPGAGSSGSKGIKLTYVCNDAEDPIHEAMVYVSEDATMVQVADLESGMPEGYQLAQKEGLALKPGATELLVWVVKTPAPAPANKNVPIKFMTDGTTVVGTREVTVVEGETLTLNAAALAVLVPEGYELQNKDQSVNVTYNTAEVRVLVSKIEVPAPANKNVPIKFMTDGTTVVGTREVTVAEGETLTLNATALAVLVPEGYELQNKDQSVNVTYNTAEVRVLVSKIEVPAPANKNVPIKFMTDGTTVVGTREVTVAEGETLTLNAAALAVLVPEGYELQNKDQSVNVTYNTAEVRVLVSKIEVPAPANKNVPIKFMTDGTTVVGTREVTVAEGETLTLNAAALAVLAPEGYELQNKDQSVNVTYNTAEVRVLVSEIEVPAPANKNVPIKFMTDGTTVVGTREVTVAEGEEVVLNGAALAVLAPEGYELLNKDQSVKVTYNTAEVRVLVQSLTKSVLVNYVTEDGTLVLTSEIVVDREVAHVNTSVLTDVPYGYEIANTGDMSIKGNHIDVVVREKEYTKSIVVNYVDEEGNLVLTSDILMSKEATHVNTSLLKDVPYGYEIAVTGDVRIEDNTVTVVVREKAYTKSVLVNYVNEADNKCVLTSSIVVYMDATSVNTALLTDVPTGYEIAVTGDMAIEGNHINVFVREKTYTKSVVVNYITEDGTLVLTSDVVVLEEQTSVNTSVLTDVPYGYEIAVTGDMPIEGNHIDVVVCLTPYTKSVLVNYVTEDGNCVLTSDIVMDKDATSVNTSLLKDVPYGYAIAITGDMPIENGQVFVTVRSTYVPEPTVPEETKPEETKPEETKPEETKPEETKPVETKPEESKPVETKPAATEGKTPNTGDASHAMTWVLLLTVSAVCAVCAFFYLKKGNANR